jgi:anti-sigma factor (TIGR02949 family)
MTSEPCSQVSSLLQPYVDAELSASEHDLVAQHVESCDACDHEVRVQQEVRAALVQLPRDAAPPGLRERVRAALDAEDAGVVELASRRSRGGAFLRGFGVMIPAAAAAAGLFFVVSGSGTDSTASVKDAIPAARSVDPEAKVTAPAPGTAASPAIPRRLPDGVELVSAPTELRYQDRRNGRQVREWADPAGTPTGTPQMFRGVQYYTGYDDAGRPRVQFRQRGVTYTFVDETATQKNGAFDSLIWFSHEVRGGGR